MVVCFGNSATQLLDRAALSLYKEHFVVTARVTSTFWYHQFCFFLFLLCPDLLEGTRTVARHGREAHVAFLVRISRELWKFAGTLRKCSHKKVFDSIWALRFQRWHTKFILHTIAQFIHTRTCIKYPCAGETCTLAGSRGPNEESQHTFPPVRTHAQHTHTRTHAHTHAHPYTHTDITHKHRKHVRTRARTHKRTQTHIHLHSYIHKHTCSSWTGFFSRATIKLLLLVRSWLC